nr:hypothetical protein [Micromonospora sp. DSM 115978]
MTQLSVIMLGVLTGRFLAASCAGGSALMSAEGECTAEDKRIATTLNELPVLEVRPGAVALREQGAGFGCTDSTNVPYASRDYLPAGTVTEVADFYRLAAPEAGWKLEYADDIHPGQRVFFGARLCFSAAVEGAIAFLFVSFPSEPDDGPEDVLGPDPIPFSLVV